MQIIYLIKRNRFQKSISEAYMYKVPLDIGHENGALFNIKSISKIKKYLNSVIPELY
jgi:hypothetical protein